MSFIANVSGIDAFISEGTGEVSWTPFDVNWD